MGVWVCGHNKVVWSRIVVKGFVSGYGVSSGLVISFCCIVCVIYYLAVYFLFNEYDFLFDNVFLVKGVGNINIVFILVVIKESDFWVCDGLIKMVGYEVGVIFYIVWCEVNIVYLFYEFGYCGWF